MVNSWVPGLQCSSAVYISKKNTTMVFVLGYRLLVQSANKTAYRNACVNSELRSQSLDQSGPFPVPKHDVHVHHSQVRRDSRFRHLGPRRAGHHHKQRNSRNRRCRTGYTPSAPLLHSHIHDKVTRVCLTPFAPNPLSSPSSRFSKREMSVLRGQFLPR